ncbi:gfo/Idh/MocA family oxidoreductase [Brevibacillus fluminis]|uniref:Gfo/Idh/MocA family oxidoreductase n=1 Tax=Brevibacillus fluminis TaxID=511487 RepID=A0A3M8CXQ4_9BACL|nr:Gfo/Idh/MocA family oxidoreductase [Brevibacillus fluminis]RNB80219.1 gfo/Idh/MocA family oxidoreductase [Brevibacillus fluminis]
MKKVRIGIVGTGLIGEVHIQAFQKHPLCEVVAICDMNESRAREIQATYGITEVYTSQAEMHQMCPLDGVVIATPDQFHRDPAVLAAAAGVPILLEKPIATIIEDAEAIIQAATTANVKLMLGMTLRYIPEYVHIQQQFQKGDLGLPINAYSRRAVRKSEGYRINGRCSVNEYLGVHDIDFLLSIFGREVDNVYSTSGKFEFFDKFGVADYYWNIIKWKNGATAALQVTWNEPEGNKNLLEMECYVNGTKGSAHVNLGGQQLNVATNTSCDYPELTLDNGYHIEADHFIKCILSDEQPYTGGQAGLDALKIMIALEQSSKEGLPVQVNL